jgi:hypothetical protein
MVSMRPLSICNGKSEEHGCNDRRSMMQRKGNFDIATIWENATMIMRWATRGTLGLTMQQSTLMQLWESVSLKKVRHPSIRGSWCFCNERNAHRNQCNMKLLCSARQRLLNAPVQLMDEWRNATQVLYLRLVSPKNSVINATTDDLRITM